MARGLIMIALAVALFGGSRAEANTECTTRVKGAFVGADGLLWISFAENQQIATNATGEPAQRIFSTVLTAIAGKMTVRYRIAEGGVACTDTRPRNDLLGLWIYA